MFPAHVETDRLHLRRFDEHADLWEAYDIFDSNQVAGEAYRYIPGKPHATPKETFDFITDAREDWKDAERAVYAVYPKAGEDGEGELIGNTMLNPQWEKRTARLGIRLRKPYWGNGYSGERAAALISIAFDRLDLDVVGAGHVPGNEQSKRAIEKYVERFGGGRDGILRNWLPHDGEVYDLHVYTITREQYETNRPADLGVVIHDD